MMVLLEIYLLVSIFSCMKAFPENPGDSGEAAIGYLLFFQNSCNLVQFFFWVRYKIHNHFAGTTGQRASYGWTKRSETHTHSDNVISTLEGLDVLQVFLHAYLDDIIVFPITR